MCLKLLPYKNNQALGSDGETKRPTVCSSHRVSSGQVYETG